MTASYNLSLLGSNYNQGGSGAVARTTASKLQESVSVKDFGAVGDGSTDDTAAIQAAINAVTLLNGRSGVFFPAGVYSVKATSTYSGAININSGLTLFGTNATIKVAASSSVGTRTISINSNDVQILGLRFTPSTITDLTNVYLAATYSRLEIRGCEFVTPQSGALYVAGYSEDVLFTENKVYGLGYGILIESTTGGTGYIVSNNVFVGSGANDGDAIEFNVLTTAISNVTISGNVIKSYIASNASAGFGIGLSFVNECSVTGNVVKSCSRNGIHLENNCTDVTVTGNTVSDCQDAGIEVQGENSGKQCYRVVISANVVKNCCLSPSTGLGRGSIDCGSSSGGTGYGVGSLIVSNNMVSSSHAAGIYTYECRFSIITGNKVLDSVGGGIQVVTAVSSVISGNLCTDDQATKTQTYGLIVNGGVNDGSGTFLQISNNMLAGNLTGAVSDVTTGAVYFGNVGADNWNSIGYQGGARKLGFFSLATPISKPTVTGAKAANAALTSLLSQLAALGLVTDSST